MFRLQPQSLFVDDKYLLAGMQLELNAVDFGVATRSHDGAAYFDAVAIAPACLPNTTVLRQRQSFLYISA